MNTTPGRPDFPGGDGDGLEGGHGGYAYGDSGYGAGFGPDPGGPYGQQPFYGDGQPFTGAPGYPSAPGYPTPQGPGFDPYQSAAFGGAYPGAAMQPYPGYQPVPPYTGPPAPRKEPALSLVLSFFLPGLGTIVNGQVGKGLGIMGGYFLGALLSVILIGLPVMFGFWVWGMVDAYTGAKNHNARYGYY